MSDRPLYLNLLLHDDHRSRSRHGNASLRHHRGGRHEPGRDGDAGIATGSLLYVVFFEIIEKERVVPQSSHLIQMIVIMFGSVTIIALKVVEDVISGGDDSNN